jgi:dynein heavy chain
MSVATCLLIFKPTGNEDERDGWNGAKIMLNNPQKLLIDLKNYGDKISKVSRGQVDKVKSIMTNPDNRLDEIMTISKAAGNLLTWVKSTVNLYEVNKRVEPLKMRLE